MPMTDAPSSRPPGTQLKRALATIGDALDWARHTIEHGFVLTVEGLRRLCNRLVPSIYFERMRIKRVSEGHAQKKSDKFVLLVLFPSEPLRGFTMNFIDSIKRSELNLVLVSNKPLHPATKSALLDNCLLLIERENVGRDFGGYKDGISVIFRTFGFVERLVIANDSVCYLRGGLDELLAGLDGEQDFIGVSEVFEHHYHVASFLMSFGRKVVGSEAFRRFWRRYRPLDTRRWAILQGEGRLSAELTGAGFEPHILYKAEHLRPHLQSRPAGEILSLIPGRVQKKLHGGAPAEDGAAIGPASDDLADQIVAAVRTRNQMHAGGFLFHKLLGLPIIKRDVVYRQIHSLDEVTSILKDVDNPDRDEVLADFTKRGTPAHLNPLQRLFYRHSAI